MSADRDDRRRRLKTAYYLEHDDERRAIARAGQRTLCDHGFGRRTAELAAILESHRSRPSTVRVALPTTSL